MRVKAGRKCIEPKLEESLRSRNHSLDDDFSAKALMLEDKKKKKKGDSSDEETNDEESCPFVEKVGVSYLVKIVK